MRNIGTALRPYSPRNPSFDIGRDAKTHPTNSPARCTNLGLQCRAGGVCFCLFPLAARIQTFINKAVSGVDLDALEAKEKYSP